MTRRLEILHHMLTHYNDCEDPNHQNGIAGSGDCVPHMSPEWNRSYRELERCLRNLRATNPFLYWHLRERYLAATVASVEARVRNGRIQLPDNCELAAGQVTVGAKTIRIQVRRWSHAVNPDIVVEALEWISTHYNGEPYLPSELVAA